MKVLHIINSLNKGGAETNLYRLLKYDKKDVNKKIFYVLSIAPDGYFSDRIRKLGYQVYTLNIANKYTLIFKIFKII